jgi:hypothetical protein
MAREYFTFLHVAETSFETLDVTSFDSIYGKLMNDIAMAFNTLRTNITESIEFTDLLNVSFDSSSLRFIMRINEVGVNSTNESKMCNLKNGLDSLQGININILNQSVSSMTNLYQLYGIDVFMAYFFNNYLYQLKTSINNTPSICPTNTSPDILVDSFTTMTNINSRSMEGFSINSSNTNGNLNVYSDQQSTSSFLNQFIFKMDDGTNYDSLSDYLSGNYSMVQNSYQCITSGATQDAQDVPFDLSYTCLGNSYELSSSVNDSTVISMDENCKTTESDDFCGPYVLKLEYDVDGNNNITDIYLRLYKNGTVAKEDMIAQEQESTLNIDSLQPFMLTSSNSGTMKTELSSETGDVTLQNITSNISPDSMTNDEVSDCLYSEDKYLRLIVHQGKVKIQSSLSPCKEFSGTSNLYGSAYDYTAVHQLNKYHHPEKIGHSGYIDNRGKMHVYVSNEINKSNTETTEFQEFSGFIMDSDYFNKNIGVNNSGDIETAKANCSEDKQCVGLLKQNGGYFNISKEDLKHVYYDRSVVTGTDDDGILLKKQNIAKDSHDPSCPHLSEHVVNISTGEWEAYLKDANTYSKEDVKCGIHKYLHSYRNKRDMAFADMSNKFNKFLEVYKSLSNEDLKLLYSTRSDMEKMKNDIIAYDKLLNKAKQNTEKKSTVHAQYYESNDMFNKSEFFFAIGGIVTISSLLFLMRTMKK